MTHTQALANLLMWAATWGMVILPIGLSLVYCALEIGWPRLWDRLELVFLWLLTAVVTLGAVAGAVAVWAL